METLCCRDKLESIKIKLGFEGLFVVDKVGRSGGIAMFWRNGYKVKLLKFGRNFIDLAIEDIERGNWRITGSYGFPESFRRRESWNLLRSLASSSSLPWVCLGDFNYLLNSSEKRGTHAHPQWKLNNFRAIVSNSGLIDLGMDGHQFTWKRSRGTTAWVEECLDRALATPAWVHLFPRAKVLCLSNSSSDHLPIFLDETL